MKARSQIYLVLVIVFLNFCAFNKEISTFSELGLEEKSGKIQIVDIDTTVYIVDKFSYSDSSISISGVKKKQGHEIKYKGELLFDNISYIQTRKTYFWPTLAYLGLNVFIVGNGVSMISAASGIDPLVEIVYPAGTGGSCPYIYSWNGSKHIIEGEAFGTALGKALETQTCIVLDNVNLDNNYLDIKITNERPETHFFNNIELIAIETNFDENVYTNSKNLLSVVKEEKKSYKVRDWQNNEITNHIINEDNIFWESDLSSAKKEYGYEDQLFIELTEVSNNDSISLILSSINTEISNIVFSYLQTLLGDDYATFLFSAETDPKLISILKESLIRSSLKVDVWDGNRWKYIDLIYPEANFVKFNKLVDLPVIKDKDNLMKIRLRSLCDVWKIDEIKFGKRVKNNFVKYKPTLLDFSSDTNQDIELVKEKDEAYLKLLPGEEINLRYQPAKKDDQKKITYAINVGGYLYEWLIDNGTNNKIHASAIEKSNPKIKLVKELLGNMDLVLPIIYKKWKEVKTGIEMSNLSNINALKRSN